MTPSALAENTGQTPGVLAWIAAPIYLLDTNTCIYMLAGQARVKACFARCQPGAVAISAVTLAELQVGVATARDAELSQERARAISSHLREIPVLPFDAAAANCCARLGPTARQRERENDKLIAAHAISRDLTLVTNDLRHFHRYPGLRLENWA